LRQTETDGAESVRAWGEAGELTDVAFVPFSQSLAAAAVSQGEPCALNGPNDGEPGLQPFERGRKSILVVPLAADAGVQAVLELFDRPGGFGEAERRLAAAAGEIGGELLRQSLADRQTRRTLFDAVAAALAATESVSRHADSPAAPPPAAVLEALEKENFRVTHVYGLTEVYGPAVVCEWHDAWNGETPAEQARLKARQGVRYPALEALAVLDPKTMAPVPADGETLGEVMFRGNIVMKGYLKNEKATQEAFAGGWFHTGDLGVLDEHGYVIIKDRSKDIIISGGENISSVEVEDILYKHPAVLFAAVVAKPDSKWGEVPCAFVELKEGAKATEADIIAFCRSHMSGFKTPKAVVFGAIPKTSTGKIQKFMLRSQVDSAKAISA
jgi:acyl-CoA synthetase (AMP-forming)/AMP-acid ligase II